MANFASSEKAYLSSYIPKVDVGTYAQVLQYKQNQYDQGIQKIQGAIDTVSGLEVYRDVDKQYLQGRMNQLQTEVSGIAGGDFSNTSVVNQAMGLASKVAKDENVQRALISTQGIKNLLADQKKLKEDHPDQYSSGNEWWDTQAMNSYLSSSNLGDKYQGPKQATRYFEWQKPIKEALDKLAPNISYKLDANGQFQYLLDETSTVTPSQVDAVVKGLINSDPRIAHQMAIDGSYTFKDLDKNGTFNHMSRTFDNEINNLTSLRKQYEAEKLKDPTNIKRSQQIDAFMADTDNRIQQAGKSKERYMNMFLEDKDLSQIKQSLYGDQVLNRYITNYQKEDHKLKLETNENAKLQLEYQYKQQELGMKQQDNITDRIKNGWHPTENRALSAEDGQYWNMYVNANRSAFKDAKGNALNADGSPVATTGSTVGGEDQGTYTEDSHLGAITSMEQTVKGYEERSKDIYAGMPEVKFEKGTPEFQQAWKAWDSKQRFNLDNNQPVNPDWRDIMQNSQEDVALLNSMKALQGTIEKQANSKYATIDKEVKIDGLTHTDGRKFNLEFNLKDHPSFVNSFVSFTDKVNRLLATTQTRTARGKEYNTPLYTKEQALNKALSEFTNNQDYELLRSVAANNKYDQAKNLIVDPYRKQVEEREKFVKESYRTQGQTRNYETITIPDDKEVQGTYKRMISEAIDAQNPEDEVKINLDKIVPVSSYWNELGEQFIKYRNDEGVTETVKVASNRAMLPNQEKHYKLEQAINISPKKSTGPLYTPNRLVKYSISKTGSGYRVNIIDGPNPIPIDPGVDDFGQSKPAFQNIDAAMQFVMKLSAQKDPATGKNLSSAQILEIIRNQQQ